MELRERLRMAIEAQADHPMRAAASALGVFWGSAAVILLLSWGAGFRVYMAEELGSFGQSFVMIYPAEASSGFPGFRAGTTVEFAREDAARVERDAAFLVEAVLPQHLSPERVLARAGSRQRRLDLTGVDERFGHYRNFPIGAGRFFDAVDVERHRRVAVLGHHAAVELYGSASAAVEARLWVGPQPFRVVGVASEKGRQYFNTNRPDDRMLLVPVTTAESSLGYADTAVGNLLVYPRAGVSTDEVVRATTQVMGPRSGFHPDDREAIRVFGLAQFLGLIDRFHAGFAVFIGFAGTVTLLIGAVGIANYHLAQIAERTREIALAKAVGARSRALVSQTLLESTLVSGAATLGGVALGLGACEAIRVFGPATLPTPIVSALAVTLTALAVVAVAVISAAIPAVRVKRIDVSLALRSE